ncbi:MAG: hypothetical protein K0V04_11190 [Deltaproteobacteria bacterium]|nr:hypothetical protein [Deltaproteobacteria bacterium]
MTFAAPTSARAERVPLTLLRAAPDDAPASVLGIDAKETKTGRNLTLALRKAFANRGLSGGEEITLDEMRLTMGCTNDEASCLSEGGKMLGVRRLVFGYLTGAKGKYQLDIQILDVETGSFQAQESIDLTKDQLSSDNIDATATEIVNQLLPPEASDSDLPPRPTPLPEVEPDPPPPDDDPPPEGSIYFGLEDPTPRWKWVGFGTTLGLTALAGGATIGMGVWLSGERRSFRTRLLELAEESLVDDNPYNNVDPTAPMSINLCDSAGEEPVDSSGALIGEPGQVRNAKIDKLCNDALDVKTAQLAAGIGTAVFGVAMLTFTGLLLIHKRKPGANAMLERQLRLGVAPTRRGLSFGAGMRF